MRAPVLTLLLVRTICATAQGDLCTGATPIVCGDVIFGNTTPFTADVAPFCGTTDGTAGGVWFRFLGTGMNTTASLCGSGFDTKIRVYSGACAALVCVAGNDNFCGLQSQVTWLAAAGTPYRILVHGFGANSGAYTLSLTCTPAPIPLCYAQTTVPYTADPYTGTALVLSDDIHSAVVGIGFPFCFAGNTYTQCVISSNNYITFDLGMAGLYSPWPTVVVPASTPTGIQNSILGPWQDLYPPAGGTITYQTLGVAPNRRFVVSYLLVSMFSCTTQRYSSQTVLYEGSNCIGSYILEKNVCAVWNGGNAVHALQNVGGTSASVVPGRNNTQWTAVSQGLLFTPTCAPCSTAVTTQCVNLVLPVELLQFRGRNEGPMNQLDWATLSEQNSELFIVERSTDGEHFDAISEQPAAGNSNALIEYRVYDDQPVNGVNYYRLRQVDVDGSEELSSVIAVHAVSGEGVVLYPDPAPDLASFHLEETIALPATLNVRDIAGRTLRTFIANASNGVIDLSALPTGTYLMELSGHGPGNTLRFTKE